MSLDSTACIETESMAPKEREDLQKKIRAIVQEIDSEIREE